MELKINEKKIQVAFRNGYEITLKFMIGDADGFESISFFFTDDQYNDPDFKENVHEFIKHINSCINLDSGGRYDFYRPKELNDWYSLGKDGNDTYPPAYKWSVYCKEWSVYCEDAAEYENIAYTPNYFSYFIPCDSQGWYLSYYDMNIVHYDNDGNSFGVNIINDDN